MIRITDLLLADEVRLNEFGRADALGIVRELFVTDFPHSHEQLALGVHFEGDASDIGTTFEWELRITGPDGDSIGRMQRTVQVPADIPAERVVHQWSVIAVRPFPVRVPGDYEFLVLLRGEGARSVRLRIGRAPGGD